MSIQSTIKQSQQHLARLESGIMRAIWQLGKEVEKRFQRLALHRSTMAQASLHGEGKKSANASSKSCIDTNSKTSCQDRAANDKSTLSPTNQFMRNDLERGDVPGWVLVVLMTTGLVTAIWTVAAPRLSSILKNSLDSMNGIR